ncbi:MAG TPA: permease prefix domain 2-containing transporter, partial [Chryseolinea sp.]
MNHQPVRPPQWPLKILKFFLKKQYHEEIEGDLEEVFQDSVERGSHRAAKWNYYWETVRLLRPVLLKNVSQQTIAVNQYPMFKNYFKVSMRNLGKS